MSMAVEEEDGKVEEEKEEVQQWDVFDSSTAGLECFQAAVLQWSPEPSRGHTGVSASPPDGWSRNSTAFFNTSSLLSACLFRLLFNKKNPCGDQRTTEKRVDVYEEEEKRKEEAEKTRKTPNWARSQ